MKRMVIRFGIILVIIIVVAQTELHAQADALVEATIEQLRTEIEIHPNNHEAWRNIGLAYGKLHRYHQDDAITSFKKAIAINPKYVDAYLSLSSTYHYMGLTKEQIAAAKEAVKLDPHNARAYGTLGAAYLKTKQFKDSINSSKKALRIQPQLAEAHFIWVWHLCFRAILQGQLKRQTFYSTWAHNLQQTFEKLSVTMRTHGREKTWRRDNETGYRHTFLARRPDVLVGQQDFLVCGNIRRLYISFTNTSLVLWIANCTDCGLGDNRTIGSDMVSIS